MKTFVFSIAACAGLLAILAGVAWMWTRLGVHMSLHGWIAYGLGAGGSLLLAAGLFHLTFRSARDGFDDLQQPGDHAD